MQYEIRTYTLADKKSAKSYFESDILGSKGPSIYEHPYGCSFVYYS